MFFRGRKLLRREKMFIPRRIIFEKNSLDYETGQNIYNYFKDNNEIEKIIISNNKIKHTRY